MSHDFQDVQFGKENLLTKRHPKPHSTAFLLIEVVLALGLVAVGMTSLLGLFSVVAKENAEIRLQTAATLIAPSLLGQLKKATGTHIKLPAHHGMMTISLDFPSTTKLIYDASLNLIGSSDVEQSSGVNFLVYLTILPRHPIADAATITLEFKTIQGRSGPIFTSILNLGST